MLSEQIRRKFLETFKEKGHTIIPSSAVVPHDDPTLLFTNAGMNQFKDLFLGKSSRDYTRAVTSQKCIRAGGKHNDLENVGHTSRHLTFFEMLGNFSFGNYFKKEAIDYAWEVVTKVFEFDPKFLWATVFLEDDESFELWKKYLPKDRIVRMGEKDNFWSMGETGPCGPCSELLYDRGHTFGSARNPVEDTSGERFFEFWNLVFMEFNRKGDGILEKLPKQSVDTGAGLERVVALKMGVDSLFETDVLRGLIAECEKVFGMTYDPKDAKRGAPFRVIADHCRSLAFAIADGAQPSNIERGYVLRKILRRAVRYGRMLGQNEPFMAKILPRLVELMGKDYPELKASESRIAEILTLEEENFLRTLKRGGNLLAQIITDATQHGKMISGEDAFKLKDTYGLPIDEIELIALDSDLKLDKVAFEKLENEAKERSRKGKKDEGGGSLEPLFAEHVKTKGKSEFLGYQKEEVTTAIVAIMKEGKFVNSLEKGETGALILQQTPFYGEKGGQVGDHGKIQGMDAVFEVEDTQVPYPEVFTHIGKVTAGRFSMGDKVSAAIDLPRRKMIANNHTATHLLHYALTSILGEHVKQAGSVVDENRLRFDFSHHKSLTQEEIQKIEDLVNEMIRKNHDVSIYELTLEEAGKKKEIKQFFGEKYGARVRVVDMGDSKELCGGTHTSHTGDIGYFRIAKESSIAAGVRRIEAVTGYEAEKFAREEKQTLVAELMSKQKERDEVQSTLKKVRLERLEEIATRHLSGVENILILKHGSQKEMKDLADLLFAKKPTLALALFAEEGEKSFFLFKVSHDLISKGVRADVWMKEVAPILGGKGGGKADFAQGGGSTPEKIQEAIKQAQVWIESILKQKS